MLDINKNTDFTCTWGFTPDDGGEFDKDLGGTPAFLSGNDFSDRIGTDSGYSSPSNTDEFSPGDFKGDQIGHEKLRKWADYWKSKGGTYTWAQTAPTELTG